LIKTVTKTTPFVISLPASLLLSITLSLFITSQCKVIDSNASLTTLLLARNGITGEGGEAIVRALGSNISLKMVRFPVFSFCALRCECCECFHAPSLDSAWLAQSKAERTDPRPGDKKVPYV